MHSQHAHTPHRRRPADAEITQGQLGVLFWILQARANFFLSANCRDLLEVDTLAKVRNVGRADAASAGVGK